MDRDDTKHREDDHVLLKDFVAWVRRRRLIRRDAPVNEKTLEKVAEGIERFLAGNKNPWPKPKGNKTKRDLMWKCFYLTFFDENYPDLVKAKRHTEDNGLYAAVGERLNLSPKTVEYHASNAKKIYEKNQGKSEFVNWLSNYKGGVSVSLHQVPTQID